MDTVSQAPTNWDGIERRSKERFGIIEQFYTMTCNAMRRSGMEPKTPQLEAK